jgi:hypothetical protein
VGAGVGAKRNDCENDTRGVALRRGKIKHKFVPLPCPKECEVKFGIIKIGYSPCIVEIQPQFDKRLSALAKEFAEPERL